MPYALSANILLPDISGHDKRSAATVKSCMLPAVSKNFRGFLNVSVSVWILVFRPPLVRPAALTIPFYAATSTFIHFYSGGIQTYLFYICFQI